MVDIFQNISPLDSSRFFAYTLRSLRFQKNGTAKDAAKIAKIRKEIIPINILGLEFKTFLKLRNK